MRLYFVRHGESEANILREFSNRGWKHPLTEKGCRQAENLAQALKNLPVARIYSSPLMRAVQTAEIVAQAAGVPVTITDALREYDTGVTEGKSDPQSWAEYMRVKDAWLHDQAYEDRIEGGESFLDMQARFEPFIEQLVAEGGAGGEAYVLVSHGGLYRSMLPLVLEGVTPQFAEDHPLYNTMWVIGETRPGLSKLACLAWGEVPAPPV